MVCIQVAVACMHIAELRSPEEEEGCTSFGQLTRLTTIMAIISRVFDSKLHNGPVPVAVNEVIHRQPTNTLWQDETAAAATAASGKQDTVQ